MTQEDMDKIKVIDEWISLHESCIRDLENERNIIILDSNRKEKNHE